VTYELHEGQWLESRYSGHLVQIGSISRDGNVEVIADGKTVNSSSNYMTHCYKPLGDA
jgi:hypothetical protein